MWAAGALLRLVLIFNDTVGHPGSFILSDKCMVNKLMRLPKLPFPPSRAWGDLGFGPYLRRFFLCGEWGISTGRGAVGGWRTDGWVKLPAGVRGGPSAQAGFITGLI